VLAQHTQHLALAGAEGSEAEALGENVVQSRRGQGVLALWSSRGRALQGQRELSWKVIQTAPLAQALPARPTPRVVGEGEAQPSRIGEDPLPIGDHRQADRGAPMVRPARPVARRRATPGLIAKTGATAAIAPGAADLPRFCAIGSSLHMRHRQADAQRLRMKRADSLLCAIL
jgi:hypothetical protein